MLLKKYTRRITAAKLPGNTEPMARVGMEYSEQSRNYGAETWQQRNRRPFISMYHALTEARIPFEMLTTVCLTAGI